MPEFQPPLPEDAEAEAPAAEHPVSLHGKLKVPLFVAAVVAVECLTAWWYLPSPAETVARAETSMAAADAEDSPEESEQPGAEQTADRIEVDLGRFSVTSFQPVSNTTLRIDFHLYGTIRAEDQGVFLALMEENQHRFRERIIVSVRSAEITDLTDAGLGLIKRQILEKTNQTLGKPLLRSVIFSQFAFIEQ